MEKPNPETAIARNLQRSLRQIRDARNLTQEQAAQIAGVPRATWAHLESGDANPTLSVLVRAANALQISVEELISAPRSETQFYEAHEIPMKKRQGVQIRQLLPDPLQSVELDRMELSAGARMVGVPHRSGTREYLTCEKGSIELTVSERTWNLAPGDVVVFRGDQRHSYRNSGDGVSVGYSVILFG